MSEPILDEFFEIHEAETEAEPDFKIRTNDLEINEVLIFTNATLILLCNLISGVLMNYNWTGFVISTVVTSLFLIVPVTYTWTWRKQSKRIDAAFSKENPENKRINLLEPWIVIECISFFLIAPVVVYYGNDSLRILGLLILSMVVLCFYYSLRSSKQSKKLDKYIERQKKNEGVT